MDRATRYFSRSLVCCYTTKIEVMKLQHYRVVVGRGRGGDGVSPTPPLFRLKFMQTFVHCCNWLLTERQCKIMSVQHVCRPKLFKNICLSLVSGAFPPLLFRTTPLQHYGRQTCNKLCACRPKLFVYVLFQASPTSFFRTRRPT